jgi:CheY-like chemotaxis protein
VEALAREADRPVILVADDDELVRALITEALSRQGLRVAVARNGRDAIGELARDDVDLALLDLKEPVLDRLETATRCAGRWSPGLPTSRPRPARD